MRSVVPELVDDGAYEDSIHGVCVRARCRCVCIQIYGIAVFRGLTPGSVELTSENVLKHSSKSDG